MDGNNRWSKKKSLNKYDAYKIGANKLFKIVDFLFNNTKVNTISAFALSVNNFKRTNSTINIIKKLIQESLDELKEKRIQYDIQFIGDINFLNSDIVKSINHTNKNLKFKKKLVIFLNYGGKEDIEKASFKVNKNSNDFRNNISTRFISDPDILIRTGGYQRISNFLLYELSFTELFFLKKLWPDISNSDLLKIINNYNLIKRNFGA